MKRAIHVRKHLRKDKPIKAHWSLRKVGNQYRVRSISGREIILGERFIEDASPEAVREVLASVSPKDRETLGQTILAKRVLGDKAPDLNRGGEIKLEHFREHPQTGRNTPEDAHGALMEGAMYKPRRPKDKLDEALFAMMRSHDVIPVEKEYPKLRLKR